MKIEIRTDCVILDGYVNAVGRDSRIIPDVRGDFIEQIVPKTFQRAISKAENIELMLNHRKNLGSTKEGNLKLHEDNIGLRAIATVTDVEVMEKAKKNELVGWSFGFSAERYHWEDTPSGIQRRYVEEMNLEEVTIVDNSMIPAYVGTSIETRAEKEIIHECRGEQFTATTEDRIQEKPEEAVTYLEYENEIKKLKGGVK